MSYAPVLVDSGFLVALGIRRDPRHTAARQWLQANDSSLLVPTPVVAESCYFLSPQAKAELLRWVAEGKRLRLIEIRSLAHREIGILRYTYIPMKTLRLTSFLLLLAVLPAPTFAQALATHTVALRTVPLTLPVEAVLEATRQATVATQVSGRIVEVRAEAGERVKAGQVLMRVDAREASEAAAAAKAQWVQAEANFQRTQNLFKQKFVSQAALDKAEADLKSARAQSGAAGAGASHATVVAPIAGIVAARHAELGELAAPGRPLVTVFDPKGLRAIASVPQSKLKEVQHAATARIEFPESRRWLDGVRVEMLPTVDAKSHTATARVYLPDDAALLQGIVPGMAARVHFVVGTGQKLTVPPAAVLRRGEISAVYVVGARTQLRQVRLGEAVADGEIEVLSGLAAGETVSLDPVKTGIELKQAK